MKILVCVKQVADNEARFSPAADNRSVQYDADTVYRMNRFDEFALEEALQIRETHKGIVDALSVGPPMVASVIKKALELGADRGIRIALDEKSVLSPRIVAGLVAAFAAGGSYDLILTGAMAEDNMYGQTGQMIAGFMKIPAASAVITEKIDEIDGTVYAEREIDALTREAVTLRLPALLTVLSGMNKPRYPSLSNVMRARRQEIITIDSGNYTINDGYENVVSLRSVSPARKCVYLAGSMQEKAVRLQQLLHVRNLWK